MTIANDLLTDAFTRVRDSVHEAVADLTADQLAFRPGERANSIAWLVWHLARVEDDHIATLAGTEQAWTAQGWRDRFDLPFPASETGYGHSPAQVAQVTPPSADLLVGYYDDVHRRTCSVLAGLSPDDFARVVDESWDPPVTLAVRLVSVINDVTQHVGQVGYLRGLLDAR